MTATTTARRPAAAPRGRAAYSRLGVAGLALIGLAMSIFVLVALFSDPAELMFMVPILGLIVLLAALAWRFGTWAKVVAIIGSLLAGLAMHWAVFGLAFPASPADFVTGMLVPIGVVLGIGGNLAAIRHRRHLVERAEPLERRILAGVAAIVVIGTVGSIGAALISRSNVEAAAGDVVVDMQAFAFPELVQARSGDRIIVHNSDAAVHDFAVPALDLKVVVLPGNDGVLDLTAAAPGTYSVYCTLHANTTDPDPTTAGMATTLVVAGS